jgi:[protein-PII] uridylyltransferase
MSDPLIVELDRRLAAGEAALPAFKGVLRQSRARQAERFDRGVRASLLVRQAALFTDAVMIRAWGRLLPDGAPAALVAVGGYGRGELHPGSDVDVLVLTAGHPQSLAAPIEQLVMFLWDMGLEIGHSVRSLAQCVDEAKADITVATNLLESRLLAGEAGLFEQMTEATGPQHIWSSRDFFAAKVEEQRRRHAKFDDSGQNLEPNIKEGPGGLRDIQTIGWVAKRHFGVSTMAALVEHGFLNDHEYRKLRHGEEPLARALRPAPAQRAPRGPPAVRTPAPLAKQFGYADASANLAVEQFMQDVLPRGIADAAPQRDAAAAVRRGDPAEQRSRRADPINRRFQARSGYLEVVNSGIFARYPLAMLEIFLLMQQNPELRGVRASTIRLARAHRHLIDDRFRRDIRARALFLEIFRQPNGLTHATRRMHRYGILSRYLPAFNKVMGLMQFDLFHVYTVDEHILMVIRNLRRFALPRHEAECPRCNDRSSRACRNPNCSTSPACSTTSPRAAAATTRHSAPRTHAPSVAVTTCPISTPTWWAGWSRTTS